MIMGIISLLFFIVGLFLFYCGIKDNYILYSLGLIIGLIGIIGLITFIGINDKIITSWFTI